MLHRLARPFFAFALTACLVSASPAFSGPTVPHKETATGRITLQIDPTPDRPIGRQEFVASGVGTHLGRYSQVGGHNFTADGRLQGTFTTTAADGSTISGNYFGVFRPLPNNHFRFDVTATWLRGTGRLAGVTGRGPVVAILNGTTGRFRYVTDATWNLPRGR